MKNHTTDGVNISKRQPTIRREIYNEKDAKEAEGGGGGGIIKSMNDDAVEEPEWFYREFIKHSDLKAQ